MKLATQLTSLPTNKLLAGAPISAVVTAAWAEAMAGYPNLSGPGMSALVGAVVAIAVAYFVPDRLNAPKE